MSSMSLRAVLSDIACYYRSLVIVIAPIILLPLLLVLNSPEASCAYAMLLMACYWLTDALPLAVTGLLPIFLFPMTGLMSGRNVAKSYMSETSMLLVGGLIMALAIEKCQLHKRLALGILLKMGPKPSGIMTGMMLPTWLLSMWISNTAATAMMIPIAEAVIQQLREGRRRLMSVSVVEEPEIPHKGRKRLQSITESHINHQTFYPSSNDDFLYSRDDIMFPQTRRSTGDLRTHLNNINCYYQGNNVVNDVTIFGNVILQTTRTTRPPSEASEPVSRKRARSLFFTGTGSELNKDFGKSSTRRVSSPMIGCGSLTTETIVEVAEEGVGMEDKGNNWEEGNRMDEEKGYFENDKENKGEEIKKGGTRQRKGVGNDLDGGINMVDINLKEDGKEEEEDINKSGATENNRDREEGEEGLEGEKDTKGREEDGGKEGQEEDTKRKEVDGGKMEGEGERDEEEGADMQVTEISKMLCLAVAYSATIGGTATLTGTAPNFVFARLVNTLYEEHGQQPPVTFSSWITFGLPHSIICILLCWLWLQFKYLGWRSLCCCCVQDQSPENDEGVRRILRTEYEKLGRMSFAEKLTLVMFIILIVLWLTRDPGVMPGYSVLFKKGYVGDAVPAVFIATLLFALPAEMPHWIFFRKKNEKAKSVNALLDWQTVSSRLAWGPIIILGGGLALAEACQVSGFSKLVGDQLLILNNLPLSLMVIVIVTMVAMLTEVTSNTAVVTIIVPILIAMATKLNINPLYLSLPATMGASYAFMLPIATPVNAIVFSYGYVSVPDMVKSGFILNIVCICVVSVGIFTWGHIAFDLNQLPWIVSNSSFAGGATLFSNTTSFVQ